MLQTVHVDLDVVRHRQAFGDERVDPAADAPLEAPVVAADFPVRGELLVFCPAVFLKIMIGNAQSEVAQQKAIGFINIAQRKAVSQAGVVEIVEKHILVKFCIVERFRFEAVNLRVPHDGGVDRVHAHIGANVEQHFTFGETVDPSQRDGFLGEQAFDPLEAG